MQQPVNPSRRRLFKAAGASGLALGMPLANAAQKPAPQSQHYTFLRPAEAQFIEAATARLIPKDEAGPGAIEAGVPYFIDQQLGGAWGAGERLFRAGPWHEGTPSQGYQLPFTPAEVFRHAIGAINAEFSKDGGSFAKLSADEQDRYLAAMQKDTRDLGGVPAKVFFESLLEMAIQGFFCDPVYGGNRDMVAWKMVGFPGAYADYYNVVGHNMPFTAAPMSLGQDDRGRVHVHPNIPARVRAKEK